MPARYDVMEQLEIETRELWKNIQFWKALAAEPDRDMDAGTVKNHIDQLQFPSTHRRFAGNIQGLGSCMPW